MSLFKRHRYETPTVTVKVDAKELANLHLDEVSNIIKGLANKMAKQEEDITRLQQAVTALESTKEPSKEPSKLTLYANGEVYKVVDRDQEPIKGTVVGYASRK